MWFKLSDLIRLARAQVETYPQFIEENSTVWFKPKVLNAGDNEFSLLYAPPELPADPFNDGSEVAFYRFNGNTNDEYGNYNGTWNGNEQYGVGVRGQAAKFDGNSYVDSNLIPNYDYITLSFWIKCSSTTTNRCIIHLSYNGQNTLALWQHTGDGDRSLYVNDSFKLNITKNFLDNKWHHIVITSETKVYVDGILSDTTEQCNTTSINKSLIVGADRDANDSINDYFSGLIDNLRIFNRVLSDEEVQQLYKLEKPYVASNGDEVFEFFDDFDGNDLDSNNWSVENFGGSYSVHDSVCEIDAPDDHAQGIKHTLNTPTENLKVLVGISQTGDQPDGSGVVFVQYLPSSGNYSFQHAHSDYGGTQIRRDTDNQGHGGSKLCGGSTSLIDYRKQFSMVCKKYQDNLSLEIYGTVSDSVSCSDSTHTTINAFSIRASEVYDMYVDYVAICKCVDTEPSVIYSDEETGNWIIDGVTYTRRKKFIVNTDTKLENYQVKVEGPEQAARVVKLTPNSLISKL